MNETASTRPNLDTLTQRNIETISRIEQAAHAARTRSDIIANAIAKFCGSTAFVWVHLVWYGGWLLLNTVHWVPKGMRFDPPPFSNLTLIVSLEAIFLSSFILISQNRQQRIADQRNHLDLQINLLAEQESSQMLAMLGEVMDHLGISPKANESALVEETKPERLVEQLEQTLESPKQDGPPDKGNGDDQ